jgi:hypothetical protein
LVAPSAVWGKTTTARIAVDLLEQVGLGWMLSPGMITLEKFLKNLAGRSVPENYEALDEWQKEIVRLKYASTPLQRRGVIVARSNCVLKYRGVDVGLTSRLRCGVGVVGKHGA